MTSNHIKSTLPETTNQGSVFATEMTITVEKQAKNGAQNLTIEYMPWSINIIKEVQSH